MVDDESKAIDSPRSSSSQESNRPIKFGGDNFEGCISNIFIERYLALKELCFMHFVLISFLNHIKITFY